MSMSSRFLSYCSNNVVFFQLFDQAVLLVAGIGDHMSL